MAAIAIDEIDAPDVIVRLGRAALVTQGVLYAIVGLLAARVAAGHESTNASQRGAIASVARQPFGRALLVVLAAGLACHLAWRLALAVRGDVGPGDDGGSVAKRLANLGRAGIYASLTVAAVRVIVHAGGGQDGQAQRRSTATVLGWPGGHLLVMAVGAAIVGAALWNLRKAIGRTFLDNLDLARLDRRGRRAVEVLGVAGYLARAVVFATVGWFLIQAGLQRDAGETRGLDQSLHRLATTAQGPLLLLVVALGLLLFGAFRTLDGIYRRPSEITYA